MDTVNDTNPPTDAFSPYRRPERLTRATDDKVVGGVAGGLGRYFGIDPVVFRIAFVVLALAGGSGVLLYLLAWLLVPDDAGRVALPRIGHERNQKLLTAVLVGGGLLILVNQLGNRGHGDVPIGFVLVAIGALVLWSRRDPSPGAGLPPTPGGAGRYVAPPPVPTPGPGAAPALAPTQTPAAETPAAETPAAETPAAETPAAERAAEAFGEPPFEGAGGGPAGPPTTPMSFAPQPTPAAPARTPKPPKEPKPPSALVPVTLSLLAVLAGGLTLVGVSARTGLALALLLTGGALIVGAWRGRARWLIPIGLALAVALAVASVVDVPIRGGSGETTFRPLTPADVRSPYRMAAGHMTLDLSAIDLSGATVTVVASVAAGHLEVVVPNGVEVDLDAHAGAGDLRLFDREADGFDVTRHVTDPGQDGAGRLVLRTRAGFGLLEVHRAAA